MVHTGVYEVVSVVWLFLLVQSAGQVATSPPIRFPKTAFIWRGCFKIKVKIKIIYILCVYCESVIAYLIHKKKKKILLCLAFSSWRNLYCHWLQHPDGEKKVSTSWRFGDWKQNSLLVFCVVLCSQSWWSIAVFFFSLFIFLKWSLLKEKFGIFGKINICFLTKS